jgi:hypothetical protein
MVKERRIGLMALNLKAPISTAKSTDKAIMRGKMVAGTKETCKIT